VAAKSRRRERDERRDAVPAQPRGDPRAFWSGTISFGLVSVPVDLFPAVRSQRTALRSFGPQGQPLQRRYYCSVDGKPLGNEEIVRGYEWEEGSFTVVTDEELEALAPRKSRDIDLRRFVERRSIPLQLLDRPYLLAPAGESTKAYHLLAATMERTGRAGIATFVMRGKEYLAAIFAEGGLLHAATMRFAAELRSPEQVGLPSVPRVSAESRRAFERVLAELADEDLDVALLRDETAALLHELAERKRKSDDDVVEVAETPSTEDEEGAEVIDIMSVLKQRMAQTRGPARASDGARNREERADDASSDELLATASKKELYERAQALDLPGRSQMTRDELLAALQSSSARRASSKPAHGSRARSRKTAGTSGKR
jgi:DNA end-binding protein Ku